VDTFTAERYSPHKIYSCNTAVLMQYPVTIGNRYQRPRSQGAPSTSRPTLTNINCRSLQLLVKGTSWVGKLQPANGRQ